MPQARQAAASGAASRAKRRFPVPELQDMPEDIRARMLAGQERLRCPAPWMRVRKSQH